MFVVTRVETRAGRAHCQRVDGARERFTLKLTRLLETTPQHAGRHYRLLGYASDERRYATWAQVLTITGDRAVLVAPEWHPARAIDLPTRHLPSPATAGTWLACTAVLAAQHSAGVQLTCTANQDPPPHTIRPVADDVEAPRTPTAALATPHVALRVNRTTLAPTRSSGLVWFTVSDRVPDRFVLEPEATEVWLVEPTGEPTVRGTLRGICMTANATLLGLDPDLPEIPADARPPRRDAPAHHPGHLHLPWWEPLATPSPSA